MHNGRGIINTFNSSAARKRVRLCREHIVYNESNEGKEPLIDFYHPEVFGEECREIMEEDIANTKTHSER